MKLGLNDLDHAYPVHTLHNADRESEMANIIEPTEGQVNEWNTWLRDRPECVRILAVKLVPWKLYRIRESGHRVTLVAFDEHVNDRVTCRVLVGSEYNLVAFEREVFGIDPADLEECDLPAVNEICGSIGLSVEECREIINKDKT